MAKPNRLDIARTAGELSHPTKSAVADALGTQIGSQQFEKAFGNAADRGLVERHGEDAGGTERWALTSKGKRRLASESTPR